MMKLFAVPFQSQKVQPQRPATRRCVLHIGSPKTGMRSIQFMLIKNRKQFLRHGILVPRSGQRPYGAHHSLAHDLAGLSASPGDSIKQDFIREVSESTAHTVVVSSESLWRLLRVPAQAERVIGCLRSLDLKIVLVLYVRNQPQCLNSAYVQNVKTWLQADDFPVFATQALSKKKKYAYSHWITFADAHKVTMLARPFSQPVRARGVTQDFLRTIGISSTGDIDTEIEKNVSVGPLSLEIARTLLRRIGGPDKLTRDQADKCRSAYRSELKKQGIEDRDYCGLTTDFASEVEARFAEDNDRFSQYAWGKPWHEEFASDVGRHFVPNDYAVTGVPADRRRLLDDVLATLGPRVDAILGQAQRPSKRRMLSALADRLKL